MTSTTTSARCTICCCEQPVSESNRDETGGDEAGSEPASICGHVKSAWPAFSGLPNHHKPTLNIVGQPLSQRSSRPLSQRRHRTAAHMPDVPQLTGTFAVSQPQETLDLDLQLSPHVGGYLVRVLDSPAGQATGSFAQPFTKEDQATFLQEIVPTSIPAGISMGQPSSRMALQSVMKEYGGRLFEALFHDDLLVCLERSLDEVRRRNGTLRVKLRLAETPELLDLPWEYLYHRRRNLFLGQSTTTSLAHFFALPDPARSLTVALPLRMLVVIADAQDLPPLDVEQEWGNLQTALGGLIQRELLILERLPQATLAELQRALRRQEYHVLHFVGHGEFDAGEFDAGNPGRANAQGRVVLTDEQGFADPIPGEVLAQLLHNERTLRMVLLNACEGSRTSTTNPFAGVAQQLVQQGVPAVIAMRHPISDAAAIAFSHEFYGALADGYSVDAAVTEGRVAVATRLGNGEWGAPQLLMHAQDGLLWRITAGPTPVVDGEAIRQDLDVLTQLMQQSNVRNLVATYRADFTAACRQIDSLSNYKAIHDLLHKLQFRCYNVIAQEARRFPDDDLALDNLLNYEVTLQDIVSTLQGVIEEAEFSSGETVWINDLTEAQQRLRQALDSMESETLRRVVWLMRRVLALQPSNVNHRLNAAARTLRLDTIVQSLNAIQAELRRFRITSDQIAQLENGTDELQRLDIQLNTLVIEHDQWQEVQRMLGRIEDMMVYDLSELEFSWPDLKERTAILCAAHKGEWVERFFQDAEQLQKALTDNNPVRVRSYFQRYRQRAGNRFFQVDTQLKDLCTELRKVGESLSSILKMLE